MESRLIPMGDGHPIWMSYFASAEAWFLSLQALVENDFDSGWGAFYVEPAMVSSCIEMYSKVLASHLDDQFSPKKFGHDSVRLIGVYRGRLPLFARIAVDAELMSQIAEYQKTMDANHVDMYMNAPKSERNSMIRLIHELRRESCRRIGFPA
jgi:hypothetical protein